MTYLKKTFLALATAVALSGAQAADKPVATGKAVPAAIRQTIEASRPDLKVTAVEPSELPGLYAVQLADGPVVYASADGRYFVLGDLYQVQAKGFANLSEQKRNVDRAKAIADVKLSDMIIFKPKTTKAVLNVFTDVECGWCQHLHKDMPKLNAMGIEVRYLAFPRAGVGSEDYQKMVTAWCARDRQDTLTRYKNRESVPINTCKDNPVAAEYELGQRLGVEGTPALVTAAGELIPGYLPPEELAKHLGLR